MSAPSFVANAWLGKRAGGAGPCVSAECTPPPCEHNEWDNVRIKKQFTVLRCRQCQKQWRVAHSGKNSLYEKCPDFNKDEGCQTPNCAMLHIHRYKQTLAVRKQLFGDEILVGVPPALVEELRSREAEENRRERESDGITDEGRSSASSGASTPSHPTRQACLMYPEEQLYAQLAIFRLAMQRRL